MTNIIYGTSYFVSKSKAVEYYTPYNYDHVREAVERKLKGGEIHIGKPPLKSKNDKLLLNREEGRYCIQTGDGKDD